jgi:hypothetical protein
VHGTTPAAGTASFAAKQFGHEFFRGKALPQCVSVAPVGAEDAVAMIEVEADTRSNSFLTDICVAGSVDQALLVAAGEFFFGLANQLHSAVERQNLIGHGREPLRDELLSGVTGMILGKLWPAAS